MQAFEFETEAKENIIEIPEEYSQLYSKPMKIIVLISEKTPPQKYDFSEIVGKLEWSGDAVREQRKIRNEW